MVSYASLRLRLFVVILLFRCAAEVLPGAEVVSEDFSTGLGAWTAGPLQDPASTLSWDAVGERMHQTNPGDDTGRITDTHDFSAGHKVTLLNDGDSATFTIDFEFNNAVWFLDFMLFDDSEFWGAGFRYNRSDDKVYQLGFGSLSAAVGTPLVANTQYTASVELEYSGGSWNPTFTVNGEMFTGDSDTGTAGPQTLHQHVQTFTIFNNPTDVHYDNAILDFTPVPEPGAAFAVWLGCGLLALGRRRAVSGKPVARLTSP